MDAVEKLAQAAKEASGYLELGMRQQAIEKIVCCFI